MEPCYFSRHNSVSIADTDDDNRVYGTIHPFSLSVRARRVTREISGDCMYMPVDEDLLL